VAKGKHTPRTPISPLICVCGTVCRFTAIRNNLKKTSSLMYAYGTLCMENRHHDWSPLPFQRK
jgi:hypothetical protein